ncbi:MAG: sugar phosphate isomerase/epimerase [Schleiferiaceae bacterium]|nr:sugar phosphate isomerase/epimerase [Schleiferiaceae bacterium]
MKKSLLLTAVLVSTLFACQNGEMRPAGNNEEMSQSMDQSDKGYQLYTVREALTNESTIKATLEETRLMGYKKVESFGFANGEFLGLTTPDFNAALAAADLQSPSGHYMPEELASATVRTIDQSSIEDFLDAAEALGQKWVIIPWMNEAWRNKEGYDHLIEYLIALGEAARERGMAAGWHNHEFEFERLVREDPYSPIAYEYLLNSLEGSNVVFEMDVHWVAFAGENPVEWMANYPGRFPLWHVKDFAADTATQVPVGQGVIPWPEVFAMAEIAGLQHYYIEQDFCAADKAVQCLEESIEWAKEQPFMD